MGLTKSRKRLAMTATACFASLLVNAAVARAIEPPEQTYRVQFDRPTAVGQSWHIDITGVRDLRWTMRDQDGHLSENVERTYGCHLIGRVTALAIRGNPATGTFVTREQIAVDTLCDYDGKTDRQLLPAGTTVLAESRGRQTLFSIAGHRPNPSVQQALAMLIRLAISSAPPHYRDLAFGTNRLVRPGESWPVDSAVLAAHVSTPADSTPANAIHGNVTLTDVETVDHQPWLKLVVNFHVDPLNRTRPIPTARSAAPRGLPTTAPSSFPTSSETVQVESNLHFTYELPADPSVEAGNTDTLDETRYTGQWQRNHRLNDYVETSRVDIVEQIRP